MSSGIEQGEQFGVLVCNPEFLLCVAWRLSVGWTHLSRS